MTARRQYPNGHRPTSEIRNIAADDADQILADIAKIRRAIAAPHRRRFRAAPICVELVNDYRASTILKLGRRRLRPQVARRSPTRRLAFGARRAASSSSGRRPLRVCGPGSMAQGHKPGEFIARTQLEACDRMMDRLLDAFGVNRRQG